jgi:hypothetical protein
MQANTSAWWRKHISAHQPATTAVIWHYSNSYCNKLNKNLRLKTNNKSTGEAQSANYLKSRITDYTTQCQLVNAKLENDELNPA